MTVYCKPKTDEALRSEIGEVQSVLLVGCPICSNLSYCIQKKEDAPFTKFSLKGGIPLFVTNEVDRVSSWLEQEGKTVEKHVFNFPGGLCAANEDKVAGKMREKSENISTIVTFSCELGKDNIQRLFPDKEVIGGMNAVGIFGAPISRKLNKMYMDHDKTNIKSFTFAEDSDDL
jgi:hypothetical protein